MLRIISAAAILTLIAIAALVYIAKKRDEELFKKLSGKVLF